MLSCLSDLSPVHGYGSPQRVKAASEQYADTENSHSDINALILDYLTAEGYPSAADKFSKEANLKPIEQQESVRLRNQIKHDIHLGSIQDAIEALNELNPQVSDYGLPPLTPSLLAVIIQVSCTTHIALWVVDEKLYHTSVLSMSKHHGLQFQF